MAQYRPDHAGTAALMRTPVMRGVLERAGQAGVDVARSLSPDNEPYGTGYITSFRVHAGGTERIAGTRRATVDIVNDAPSAVFVEIGSRGHPGHHVLSRTLDVIGT